MLTTQLRHRTFVSYTLQITAVGSIERTFIKIVYRSFESIASKECNQFITIYIKQMLPEIRCCSSNRLSPLGLKHFLTHHEANFGYCVSKRGFQVHSKIKQRQSDVSQLCICSCITLVDLFSVT